MTGILQMMAARGRQTSSALATLALLACGHESGSVDSMIDEYSIDAMPTVPITEELRLGSLEDPNFGFTSIHWRVHVTEGDTLYVAELSVPEIRAYTADGRLVRRIGRRGQGPGELQAISHWGVQGDTVWVIEDSPPRITLFSRDGSLISTVANAGFRITSGRVYGEVRPVALRADGRFDGGLVTWGMPYPYDGPRETLAVPHVIFDASGEAADTLGYGEKSLGGLPEIFETVGGVRIDQREAFPSGPLWARAGWDSIQVLRPVAEDATGGLVTVLRLTVQGDTVFRRGLRYTPRSMDEGVRDSVIDARVASYPEHVQELPGIRRAVAAMTVVPSFYPPIQSMVVTVDESIWLCHMCREPDGWHWILLGSDGSLRGKVSLPAGALVVGHQGSAVYTSERDEFGVPWLVRYRLAPGA